MDYRKSNAPVNTVTRNVMDLCKETGNIYESVVIISKRANQISVQIKEDLSKKLSEKLPKPSLLATQEFIEGKIYWRNPADEVPADNERKDDLI